ncbi:MAG: competence protein ComEC [Gammaproteobacteria bacterium]|jgi:competence protein ComEC
MLAWTLAFATGIYCLLQFSTIPSLWVLLILPLLFLLNRYFSAFRLILLFCLGFSWALLRIGSDVSHSLNPDLESKVVQLTGNMISLPVIYDDHVQFLFDVNDVVDNQKHHFTSPGIIRLNWYKTKVIPAPGETWLLSAKLKRPYSFMNSGGFDYETWMMRQGIKATGYVKKSKTNQMLRESNGFFMQRLRYKLSQEIKNKIDKPLRGLVLALSLGDRSQLDPNQWRALTHTGTNHLIAISGLHLGLIAGLIYFLSQTIWRQFYFATQIIPAPIIASILAFAGAFIYAALAGFSLPTQRALIMIAVFLLGLLSSRRLLVSNVVCIAIFLILLLDPFSILAADFWLSFTAVTLILYITRYRHSDQSPLRRWLQLQCLLSLGLTPFLIFWFKQFPLYSIFANLLAIPIIGFIIVPLVLLAMVLLLTFPRGAEFIYDFVGKISNLHWSYLDFLSQQNSAIIPVAATNKASLIIAIIGIVILLMPKGLPGRWLGLLFLLPLLFPITTSLRPGEFKFSLLDVGQGLSAVIQTSQKMLVYDAGARFSERFNIGDAVIKPYLRHKGITQLDMLMISHGDNDHIGGAYSIIEQFRIDRVLSSVPEKLSISHAERCHAGQKWLWDGVEFEVLHPSIESDFTGNNASCVLKVSSQHGSVLLTGDIEQAAEKSLINNMPEQIKVDILLAPHHGSKTSSSNELIATIAPEYAVISAGYRNRFGFPKQDIMSRYEAHGVKTLVTFMTGEISMKFSAAGLIIEQFRSKNRRFWHH